MASPQYQQLAEDAFGLFESVYSTTRGSRAAKLQAASDAVKRSFGYDHRAGKPRPSSVMSKALESIRNSIFAAERLNKSKSGRIQGMDSLPCLQTGSATGNQPSGRGYRYIVRMNIQIGDRVTTRTDVITSRDALSKMQLQQMVNTLSADTSIRIEQYIRSRNPNSVDVAPVYGSAGSAEFTVVSFSRC